MITPAELEKLKLLTDHFEQRKVRASERLAALPPGRWYFGIVGLNLKSADLAMDGVAKILAVVEPPGEVELAKALKNKSLLSAVGRYSSAIRHELVIEAEVGADGQSAFNLAWWIISAIRVRSGADLLVPVVANSSWSTVAALSDGACDARLLEDVPRTRRLSPASSVTEGDIAWVSQHLVSFATLLEIPRFRLAVDCLTTFSQEASLRMATASLWTGIEALFGISAELRYRLAILAASFLEERGPERIRRYRAVKHLYDLRSKAVHGATVADTDIEQHCRDSRMLLSALVCRMTETASVPEGDEWDTILLG